MRIVVATDSFKGSLTAKEAGDAIILGVKRAFPFCNTIHIPMADGGEGTVQSLVDATRGSLVTATVHDPLMRPVSAVYGILGGTGAATQNASNVQSATGAQPAISAVDSTATGKGKTAVIEMAEASGLPLLALEELNPTRTTTYGTGELILHALGQGCRNFIIGLGGSATNDGGMGMLSALGVRFLDTYGELLPHGGLGLQHLHHIDISGLDPRLAEATFLVACDVDNPLCGENGASAVYGPQKGATLEMVEALDAALAHYAQVVEKDFGKVVQDIPGAGAAGGLGAGILGFLQSHFYRGIDLVIETTRLKPALRGGVSQNALPVADPQPVDSATATQPLANPQSATPQPADLVITGEGKIDAQTLCGKTPYGVAQAALKLGIPVIALCGMVGEGAEGLLTHGFAEIHGLIGGAGVDSAEDVDLSCNATTPEYAMAHGAELLEELAYKVMARYKAQH